MLKTLVKLIALGIISWGGYQYLPRLISNFPTTQEESSSQPLVATETIPITRIKSQYQDLELQVHRQVNQYRQSQNLSPLQLSSVISQQARLHSEKMAAKKTSFSHNGFEKRIKIISRQIPYRSAAENLAYNQGYSNPVSHAVKGWIKSPGHHKNMIGNFNLTGIGIAKNAQGEYYFTQIFIKKR